MKLFSFFKDNEQVRQAAIEKRKAKRQNRDKKIAKKMAKKLNARYRRSYRKGDLRPMGSHECYWFNDEMKQIVINELNRIMGKDNFVLSVRPNFHHQFNSLSPELTVWVKSNVS